MTYNNDIAQLLEATNELWGVQEENTRLKTALAFYADSENWKSQDRWCPARGTISLQSCIKMDEGHKAREALGGVV